VVIGRHYTRDDGPVLYALQRIHGVGPTLTERYGETILALVGHMPL